jgi:hypothetical protein
MIREATFDDIPVIQDLGRKFLSEGPYKGRPVKDEQTEKFAKVVISSLGKVLLWEEEEADGKVTGILGFILVPHYFTGEMIAQELMWYVEPEYRKGCAALKLLWEAQTIAKRLGAKMMQFTAPTSSAAKLYDRFGYKLLEVTFEKVL